MPESKSPCFSDNDLRNYLTGWSENDVATQIESHLEHCETCEETLVMLEQDSDTLIERLRESESAEQAENSQIASALSKSRALVPSSRPTGHDPSALQPESVGSYDLIRPIGSGGMGAVYLAKHRELGKTVAIKLVPTRLGEQDQRSERFLREMRAAGSLNHPSIVSATDAGREGDFHYLVMEHIDGFDLSRICRGKSPIAVADACELIRRAAAGLDYAHSHGVIHRDIKPSNLMLSRDGELKILDFGLARMGSWEDVPELTSVGQLMGTLDYMSPEQAERPEAVDYRADLYSLGATLFRLLAGRPPLAAAPDLSPLAKLKLLAEHQPPRLDTLRPDLPKDLVDLVARMLDRNPESRPPSASHIAETLQPLCDGHALSMLVRMASKVTDEAFAPKRSVVAKSAHTSPPANRNTRRWWMAAAFVPFFLLAGWLTIETQKGRLVIETDADDVMIQVIKNGKTHRKLKANKGTTTTRLFAGDYELRIEGPESGLVINGQRVQIKRGETTVRELGTKLVPASTYLTSQSPIEPGYELEIKCLVDDQNSGTFRVMADDTLKLPLVGVVSVKGKTLQSLEQELNRLYAKWYKVKGTGSIAEVFFANSTLNQMVAVHETPFASEPATSSTLNQPVFDGQPIDFWLSTIKYEHHIEKLEKAVQALETLGKQTPDRRSEVSAELMRTITKTNAFTSLSVINTPEQYTDLMLECLQGDDNKAKIRLLGSGLRTTESTGVEGMKQILRWIDSFVFVAQASEANKELLNASHWLYARLASESEPEINELAKATLRRATLEEPRVIPPNVWMDYRSGSAPFIRKLRLELFAQLIASPDVSEEDLGRSLLEIRSELASQDNVAWETVENFGDSFYDALSRHLIDNLDKPGRRNSFIEIFFPPRDLEQVSFAAQWHLNQHLEYTRVSKYEKLRVYPRLQLCLLINDLALADRYESSLAALAAACEPAAKRLSDKDVDPETFWSVFTALESRRPKDSPNDYFDALVSRYVMPKISRTAE